MHHVAYYQFLNVPEWDVVHYQFFSIPEFSIVFIHLEKWLCFLYLHNFVVPASCAKSVRGMNTLLFFSHKSKYICKICITTAGSKTVSINTHSKSQLGSNLIVAFAMIRNVVSILSPMSNFVPHLETHWLSLMKSSTNYHQFLVIIILHTHDILQWTQSESEYLILQHSWDNAIRNTFNCKVTSLIVKTSLIVIMSEKYLNSLKFTITISAQLCFITTINSDYFSQDLNDSLFCLYCHNSLKNLDIESKTFWIKSSLGRIDL